MNCEYPNLEKVNHLIFLQTTWPIEKYPEIIDNVLNKHFLQFIERKRNNYNIFIISIYFIITMESNNINRISATGFKSVEIDDLNTSKIIINNEGLQYYHEYNRHIRWRCFAIVVSVRRDLPPQSWLIFNCKTKVDSQPQTVNVISVDNFCWRLLKWWTSREKYTIPIWSEKAWSTQET